MRINTTVDVDVDVDLSIYDIVDLFLSADNYEQAQFMREVINKLNKDINGSFLMYAIEDSLYEMCSKEELSKVLNTFKNLAEHIEKYIEISKE